MSNLFYCKGCGHNLTFISHQRLKCYGCEKYFVDSYNSPLCGCPKSDGFRYSVEIIAPNKGKCLCCGREMEVVGNLEPPDMDKYGGARGGGLGSWDGQVGSFQPTTRKPGLSKKSKQKIPAIERPEVEKLGIEKPEVDGIYVLEDRHQIIIKFPGHKTSEQIRCEIVNDFLEVQSRLVDFFEKFPLPDFPVELETNFKNAILDIHLKKQN